MKFIYDKENCSRCGGTGRHSYCASHGTKCFKCNGTGQQLTRAAAAAKKKVNILLDELRLIDPAALNPGDVILNQNIGRGYSRLEVTEIKQDPYNEDRIIISAAGHELRHFKSLPIRLATPIPEDLFIKINKIKGVYLTETC